MLKSKNVKTGCVRLSALLILSFSLIYAPLFCNSVFGQNHDNSKEIEAAVVFTGGHETDPRDHGRPVVLIAAALGVTADVFREAFRRVHPAGPGRRPDESEARENKRVLMEALARYDVSDERLNEVSDYYRYPESGEHIWRQRSARAHALIRNGKVIRFVIEDAGAGYSSPPEVSIPQLPMAKAKSELLFDRNLEKNGGVAKIILD